MNFDLRKDLNTIFKESFNFKADLLRSIITDNQYPKSKLINYLKAIDAFLKMYDDYKWIIMKDLQSIEAEEGVNVVNYSKAKSYIYLRKDYSSVLNFADGVIRGINDLQFVDKDKLDNFREYVLAKAFPGRPLHIELLLDEINSFKNERSLSDDNDVTRFNIIKDFELFDKSDKYELYTAIERTLTFIVDKIIKDKYSLIKDSNMYPECINAIIEYINYSLNIFAAHVYVISEYVYSYKNNNINESTYSEIMKDNINTMNRTDEIYTRDFSKYKEFNERLIKFLDKIGIKLSDKELSFSKSLWYDKEYKIDNKFYKELLDNELFKLLIKTQFEGNINSSIIEFNTDLRALYYSNKHAIEYINTPKDKLLYMIKNIGDENNYSLSTLKNIIKDYVLFGLKLLNVIKTRIEDFMRYERSNSMDPELSLSADIKNSETFKILGELYRDIAGAILYKGRDLEVKYNKLNNKRLSELSSNLMIDDYSSDHQMSMQVSQTLRNPDEFKDDFIRQEFEQLQLESVYLMYEYGLENDYYYTNFNEAFSLSDIMNKLYALLEAFKKKISIFFNNANFKKAVEWVNGHKQELTNMKFNGTLRVLPYTKNIDISYLGEFINTINAFDKNILTDENKVKQYITKLYTIKNKSFEVIFNNDAKKAKQMYHNFILFNNTTDQPIAPIDLSNDNIKTHLINWIDNVGTSDNTHKILLEQSEKLKTALNGLKSKVANLQSSTPPTQNNNQKEDSSIKQTESNTSLNNLLIQINTISINIFDGIYDPITKSILDQYQYIKEAYSIKA